MMTKHDLQKHASKILEMYSRRIALDDIDGLLYMTVGSQRLKLVADLTRRMNVELQLKQQSTRMRSGGAYLEAVLGDFGCGKSHIGYLLQHNALCAEAEVLVARCQMTGEMTFSLLLAAILRSLRVSGSESIESHDIEISAYRKLTEWAGGGEQDLTELIRGQLLNLPQAVATALSNALKAVARPQPDAAPLQEFLSTWVERSEPRVALAVFEQILRLFSRVQVTRVCLIIDEFEALSAAPEQQLKETLQYLQALHDDFAAGRSELPSLYAVFLSTDDFWQLGSAKMPSLLRAGDRVRRTSGIPNISKLEIMGLMERYMTLHMLNDQVGAELDYESFSKACDECWTELAGRAHHMRSVHTTVREKVEQLLSSTQQR